MSYFILLLITTMAQPKDLPTTIKFVKKIDKGYLIKECILTEEGQKKVAEWDWKFSRSAVQAKCFPYDSTKWIETVNKDVIQDYCQYFQKTLD